jgi:two-component system NtrC family sensor kinase
MVAPLDTFIYFQDLSEYERFRDKFETRSGTGGGRVFAAPLLTELVRGIDDARSSIGGAPLGVVTSSQGDALEAIVAGADDAAPLQDDSDSTVTTFLDRVRTRAQVRREGERRQRDFVHAEKLAALGSVVAGVAHEVNNPLSTITLAFDIIRGNFLSDLTKVCDVRDALETGLSSEDAIAAIKSVRTDSKDLLGLLDDMVGATDAVAELVRDLRVFSRSDTGEQAVKFRADIVVDQALRLVRKEFGPNTLVEFDVDEDLPELFLPKNRLAQVLTNLLLNAAHATREVQRDMHRIRIGARVDEQHLALSISDTGPGIPEDSLEKIFDPFFTTKREGQGTGLGLSTSRSILQHMGGDMAVSSVDGSGATFVCFLPLPDEMAQESTQRRREPLPTSPPPGPRSSVLMIDDDARVLRVTARILQEHFNVLVARDGREACELLESGSRADAVLLELALPEMDGPEFYRWALSNKPHLKDRIVFLTAAQERDEYRRFLQEFSPPIIHKPPSRERLLGVLVNVVRSEAERKATAT